MRIDAIIEHVYANKMYSITSYNEHENSKVKNYFVPWMTGNVINTSKIMFSILLFGMASKSIPVKECQDKTVDDMKSKFLMA